MSANLFSRAILAVVCFLLLAQNSPANIVKSKDSLVGTREHNLLKGFAKDFGFPVPEMKNGQSVCLAELTGVNLQVLVVGPSKRNAQNYALILEAWGKSQGFSSEVEYSQEADCSAARLSHHVGGFGRYTATTEFDLKSLFVNMRLIEPNFKMGFLHPIWTKTNLTIAPDKATTKNLVWIVSDRADGFAKVATTLTIQKWMPVVLVLWLTIPIIGYLIGAGMGLYISKRHDLPISARRTLYSKLFLGSVYGSIGLHTLLVMATLPTKVLDPLSQLWFGSRFSTIGILFVPLFMFVPLAMRPLIHKIELKLFGPTESELAQIKQAEINGNAISRDVEERAPTNPLSLVSLRVIFYVLGISLFAYSFILPSDNPWKSILRLIGLVFFIAAPYFKASSQAQKFVVDESTYEQIKFRVQDRTNRLAKVMNLIPPKTEVIRENIGGKYFAGASFNSITLSLFVSENLPEPQLDFVLAHELSHIKYRHSVKRLFLRFSSLSVSLVLLIVLTISPTFSRIISPYFTFIFFVLFAIIVFGQWAAIFLYRQQEFAADELAVRTTRDPEAAIQTLLRITSQSEMPGLHQVDTTTHPMTKKRIERIQALQIS